MYDSLFFESTLKTDSQDIWNQSGTGECLGIRWEYYEPKDQNSLRL